MSGSHGELKLLVATGDQSFGSAVVDAVEATEETVDAEHVGTATRALRRSDSADVDGAVVDDRIAEPTTVVDRLTGEWDLPVVVLTDPREDGETITRAIEAGATDVFPRTTTNAQYELVVERIATESDGSSPASDSATDDRPYREVFENVSDGLVVHELDSGEMLDVNERFCEMTGYSRDELVGETVSLITAEEEGYPYEQAKQMIRRAREEGAQLFEWREQHKDGHTFPVEVHLTLVELHGEQRVLASVRDITERKQREQEFEQIFNGVNDVITIHDPETAELLEINDTFCDLLGYDRQEILEMGLDGYTATEHGYTVEKAREFIREVVESGETKQTDWAVETADGEIRWLDVEGTTVEIGGELRYVAIDRDVTEQRRREREYEQVFNGVQDGLQIMDPETLDIIDVNDAYLDMFGYDSLEDIRKAGVEGLSLTEEGFTFEQGKEIHQRVQETGEPETLEWRAETADGEPIWLELKVMPALVGGEEQNIVVHRDITERKRREQRLEVFNRILRHNLRNQLEVIRSHAEVLDDRDRDDHAERIIAAADQLAGTGARARTIDQIMSMDDTRAEIHLEETVRGVVASIDVTRSDVTVRTELPTKPPLTTNGEAVRLAVESALENAIEHAESAVTAAIEDAADGYVVRIEDDGPGIPPEELAPLEARTETSLQHGRGLGLWQLRWSVDALNGELSFDTTEGTTVRITVPDQRDATHTD